MSLRICGVTSVLQENTTVTAISQASADTAGSNVLSDDLSRVWRAGGIPVLEFKNASDRFKLAECVYLVDHNLDSYTVAGNDGTVVADDQWRIISSSGVLNLYQSPSSIQEQTNLSGVSFTERNVFSSTTNYFTPLNPAILSRVRVRFTIAGSGVTLSATQFFQFRIATLAAGSCTYTVRLKEGGVLRATLVSAAPLVHPVDTNVGFSWNSSLIPSGVPELEIEITPGTTSAKIAAPVWYPDIASVSAPASDSGWIPVTLPAKYRQRDRKVLTDVYFFPSAREVASLYVILDRGGFHALVPDNKPAQVSRVECGLAPVVSMKRDAWRLRLVDPSSVVEMRGGNERFHVRRKFVEAEVDSVPLPIAEALSEIFHQVEQEVGITKCLLWLFDPEDAHGGRFPIFGRLKGLGDYGNTYKFFLHGFSVRQSR